MTDTEKIAEFAKAWQRWQEMDGWDNEGWNDVVNTAEELCRLACLPDIVAVENP
jgi:hypothetical protein